MWWCISATSTFRRQRKRTVSLRPTWATTSEFEAKLSYKVRLDSISRKNISILSLGEDYHTCIPAQRCWGGKFSYVQEFKTSVGNIIRANLEKKKKMLTM
jgi:hypothetical protein